MSIYDLYQSYLNAQQESPVMESPVDPNSLLYLQQQAQGEGLEGIGLGGRYGNLDLSNSKTFVRDVYSDVLGPPGSFEFVPTELEAFYNPTLGNYQTFAGKNISPMLSNTGEGIGFFGNILANLGLQPPPVGGFVPGSIRGYYDSFKDFTQNNKNIQQMPQETKAGIRSIQQKLDKDYSGPGFGGGADMGGGRDNTGGDRGSAGAADRFSNTSGRGRTGY